MKATTLLKEQHDKVDQLFKRLEKTKKQDIQKSLFEELAHMLVAHDAIERKIFYPACEKKMGMTDLLGEALVEHGLVEFSLYEADIALGKKDFEFKCTVLSEVVEHHVDEEEKEFFPKVEKALGKDLLEELGMQMEEAFKKEEKRDFRVPLCANLKQVLAGILKPSPKKSAASNGKPSRSEITASI